MQIFIVSAECTFTERTGLRTCVLQRSRYFCRRQNKTTNPPPLRLPLPPPKKRKKKKESRWICGNKMNFVVTKQPAVWAMRGRRSVLQQQLWTCGTTAVGGSGSSFVTRGPARGSGRCPIPVLLCPLEVTVGTDNQGLFVWASLPPWLTSPHTAPTAFLVVSGAKVVHWRLCVCVCGALACVCVVHWRVCVCGSLACVCGALVWVWVCVRARVVGKSLICSVFQLVVTATA